MVSDKDNDSGTTLCKVETGIIVLFVYITFDKNGRSVGKLHAPDNYMFSDLVDSDNSNQINDNLIDNSIKDNPTSYEDANTFFVQTNYQKNKENNLIEIFILIV